MNLVKFLILAVIGLLIRLWLVPQWADVGGAADTPQYERFARNLVQHGVFSDDEGDHPVPNARRMPGYPFFLATIYSVCGLGKWRAVQVAQAVIDLLTCWLVYRTARELFRDRLVGFWSFGTALICAPVLIFSGYVLPETLATFWVTLAVYCALKGCRDNRNVWFIGLGISCAAAAMMRPTLALLPVFLLPAFYLTPEGRRFFTLKRAGLAVFCWLFLMLPWVTRNAISLHEFNFLSAARATKSDDRARGYHRWLSTWVDSQAYNRPLAYAVVYQRTPGYKPDDLPAGEKFERSFPKHAFDTDEERLQVKELMNKVYLNVGLTDETDQAFARLAAKKIRAHPLRYYVALPLYRMLMLWTEPPWHWFINAPPRVVRLAQLISIAIVAFGFGGLWVIRHHWRDAGPLWLAMLGCTLGGVVTCFAVATVNPRFVVPVYPQMCIFASACAFHLTRAKSPLKTSTEIYEPDYDR
ncbi:MAG: glycosyltransferase family 39 protein [Verrucomicrobiae bacterium]|nr:glycosyltransferase family 39 protein [Verrucomicrobiae bacterium]